MKGQSYYKFSPCFNLHLIIIFLCIESEVSQCLERLSNSIQVQFWVA